MRKESLNFEITNTTKGKLPSLPFVEMKDFVLGKEYDLSLAFIDSKKSRELNLSHRRKDKPANILSFPLSSNSGEIFIDLSEAKKHAPKFEENSEEFVAHLFIHGLLHLKGMAHGSKMNSEEKKIRAQFPI